MSPRISRPQLRAYSTVSTQALMEPSAAVFGENEFVSFSCRFEIGLDFRNFYGVAFFAGGEMRRDGFFIDVAHELFLRIGEVRDALHVIGVATTLWPSEILLSRRTCSTSR